MNTYEPQEAGDHDRWKLSWSVLCVDVVVLDATWAPASCKGDLLQTRARTIKYCSYV